MLQISEILERRESFRAFVFSIVREGYPTEVAARERRPGLIKVDLRRDAAGCQPGDLQLVYSEDWRDCALRYCVKGLTGPLLLTAVGISDIPPEEIRKQEYLTVWRGGKTFYSGHWQKELDWFLRLGKWQECFGGGLVDSGRGIYT